MTARSESARAREVPAVDPEFLGHPLGLFFLSGTELWDRISFHGMQALLVLYMVEEVLLPGHVDKIVGFAGVRGAIEAMTGPLSVQALAAQIFGLYIGFIYLLPILGGFLGDRLLGRRWAVTLGAVLMTLGHFCMAFERLFLIALSLLIVGAGILRGNLISQAGDLYRKEDPRRENGFQIYYIVANTGSFVAPIVTGTLTQLYGWHYGFGFAGVGMLVGLILYLSGKRYLPTDAPLPADTSSGSRHPGASKLTPRERRTVVVLLLMLPLLTLFWVAQAQVWDTYPIWVRDHVDLMIGGWRMPVPWLQAVDGLSSVVVVPPVLLLWRWQAARSRVPGDLTKVALGCLIFGAAVVWLAVSGSTPFTQTFNKVPLVWAVVFHVLSSVGWVYFGPTALAIFSRAAPAPVNAMMVGVYHLSIFGGGAIAGRLGGFYERLSTESFWLLHAAIIGGGGLLFLLLGSRLRQELGLNEVTPQVTEN